MALLDRNIMKIGNMLFDVDPDSEHINVSMENDHGKEVAKTRIKRMDLWSMVYAMSGPNEQDMMTPVRQSEVVTYRRIHNIKITKPVKVGDIIKCKCEINVEKTVVEGLKGMVEQQKTVSGVPIIGAKWVFHVYLFF